MRLGSSIGTILVYLLILVRPAGADSDVNLKSYQRQHDAAAQKLRKMLQDDTLWEGVAPKLVNDMRVVDKTKLDKMLGLLKLVRLLRLKSIAPTLVPHIAYSPYRGMPQSKIIPMDVYYPVYGALKAIGIPAIPSLLGGLKVIDLDEKSDAAKVEQYKVTLKCVAAVYAEGKFFSQGIPYAILRIRTEIKNVRKKTRTSNSIAEKRLERAIKDLKNAAGFFDEE